MELKRRIEAFDALGRLLQAKRKEEDASLTSLLEKAQQKNGWFTQESVKNALSAFAGWLEKEKLEQWVSGYQLKEPNAIREIGVIMAGNIPLAGFHDFLCILLSGHAILAKPSSDDPFLLPGLAEWLIKLEPDFAQRIFFSDKLENPDAVIATGSNNSSRYFEYYFGKYPHIIRANRNSVAVLTGNETADEINALGKDIFTYFGLGCRSVSKLYIKRGHDFSAFFQEMERYSSVMSHSKYMNNYDYQRAVLLLNNIPFLTNNFLIVKEDAQLSTPVAVLNYEYYDSENDLKKKLDAVKDGMQCIVGHGYIPFGQSQNPSLMDYADGVDVMKFLKQLADSN